MDASPSHKLIEPPPIGLDLDPNSPEFFDACKALIKRSSTRGLPGAAARLEGTADGAQVAALRDVWLRHAEDRAELDAVRAELADVASRYEDTTRALQAASEDVRQTSDQLTQAHGAIAERDRAIEQLQLSVAERDQQIASQDRLIEGLQSHLLLVEEARAADAAAILESLDRYRT